MNNREKSLALRPFDPVDYLSSVTAIEEYVLAALEEGDPEVIGLALGDAARARARLAAQPVGAGLSEAIALDLLLGTVEGDSSAAREHLDAGFPIYYVEDDTPEGLLIKMWPDGRRELVRFDEAGDEVVRVL